MSERAFVPATSGAVDQRVLFDVVHTAISCGAMSEWSDAAQACVCVAGYQTVLYRGWALCVPCPNGTVRPQYATGGCVGCNITGSYAPWLAMSACVCTPDLYPVVSSGGELLACYAQPSPSYYAMAWVASPLVAIPACAVLGALALVGGLMCA